MWSTNHNKSFLIAIGIFKECAHGKTSAGFLERRARKDKSTCFIVLLRWWCVATLAKSTHRGGLEIIGRLQNILVEEIGGCVCSHSCSHQTGSRFRTLYKSGQKRYNWRRFEIDAIGNAQNSSTGPERTGTSMTPFLTRSVGDQPAILTENEWMISRLPPGADGQASMAQLASAFGC